jgi:hypothetical protein
MALASEQRMVARGNLRSYRDATSDGGAMTQKLCKDCEYHRRFLLMPEDGRCRHPQAAYTNLISGAVHYRVCSTMRGSGGPCGPDARLFERPL